MLDSVGLQAANTTFGYSQLMVKRIMFGCPQTHFFTVQGNTMIPFTQFICSKFGMCNERGISNFPIVHKSSRVIVQWFAPHAKLLTRLVLVSRLAIRSYNDHNPLECELVETKSGNATTHSSEKQAQTPAQRERRSSCTG